MLNVKIWNAKLLSYLGLRIPSPNGRSTDLFAVKASNSPINRTSVLYNRIVWKEPLVDIFKRNEYSAAVSAVLAQLDG